MKKIHINNIPLIVINLSYIYDISLQKKFQENSEEIFTIKSDIKLIKLSRIFKMLVNYIYHGLNLYGEIYCEDKIKKIIEFLDNLDSDNYDKELIKSTKAFIFDLYEKIDLRDNTAKYLDLSISVLDQLFDFIDKQRKHEDFKNRVKFRSNTEMDIKDLIMNIENKNKKLQRLLLKRLTFLICANCG